MSPLTKRQIRDLYIKRARNYDFSARSYYLIGFRDHAYRQKAVRALSLNTGDTVVDICCGTGLNFPLLHDVVGPEGKIIGVDLTEDMLVQAEIKVKDQGWKNVELVHSDAASYLFPENIHGVISTYAITLVQEYDSIIQRGAAALASSGRCVILDFKIPSNTLAPLAPLGVLLTKSFGVSMDLSERHPWESIRSSLKNFMMEDLYGGFSYIASGTK